MDVYGNYALEYPNKLKFVAVAKSIQIRKEKFALLYEIPLNRTYDSWEEPLAEKKFAVINMEEYRKFE